MKFQCFACGCLDKELLELKFFGNESSGIGDYSLSCKKCGWMAVSPPDTKKRDAMIVLAHKFPPYGEEYKDHVV